MRHRFTLPPLKAAAAAAIAAALLLSGCAANPAPAPAPAPAEKPKPSEIVLASTTSTQDSGLFSVLIPAFEKDNPDFKVKVVAVGSGEALKLGEKKDADVLLVHSKKAELAFVEKGFGGPRKDVMYNDFVIVGPASDPGKIKGTDKASAAFKKIAAAGKAGKAVFVARGDASGTSTKEMSIWTSAGVEPTKTAGSWYLSTGQGMGEVLKLTSEKQGYTLSDRATWLTMKDSLQLTLLVEGDKALFNQYGVIPVAGAKNAAGAQAFADWITGPKGQEVIKSFGVEKYGQALFIPNAK
ncbi:MAG TPA: extracellular solute-binding protein [Coriobacteriia bacterium]|jgi:tungstate transport system substrate-binding protein